MNSMVTSLSGLVLRNLTRFVTSDFYPERMRKTKDYEYTVLAGQAIKGDHSLYLGFAAQNDMSGVIELAKGFAKEDNNLTSDEVYDAVCEFCNLNNGLLHLNQARMALILICFRLKYMWDRRFQVQPM